MGNEKSSLIIKAPAKNEKLYSVEFLRFIFACVIVYFHFLHTNIMNYTGGSAFYQKLADNCSGDKLVECFFILSGFFLFFTSATGCSERCLESSDTVPFMEFSFALF
mgnify:CR=1 FL=1